MFYSSKGRVLKETQNSLREPLRVEELESAEVTWDRALFQVQENLLLPYVSATVCPVLIVRIGLPGQVKCYGQVPRGFSSPPPLSHSHCPVATLL